MADLLTPDFLRASLRRALLGQTPAQLLQASIEADARRRLVRVCFEFEGEPSEEAWESCSCAATEVISDFPAPWTIDEIYVARSLEEGLTPLAWVGYLRSSN
ncbi:MAG: hypothetical protein ACN6PQ_13635 [Stenotrophomonas indicatrix]|jgi:hypothetical protein|uniref:hypothetical protein n=1 Tax=Stenotrophomonas indicatrix TaxID=2045451 RepID=UPI00289DC5E9|nr:hypothetical protein [Stenotrophomonas indicatrix]